VVSSLIYPPSTLISALNGWQPFIGLNISEAMQGMMRDHELAVVIFELAGRSRSIAQTLPAPSRTAQKLYNVSGKSVPTELNTSEVTGVLEEGTEVSVAAPNSVTPVQEVWQATSPDTLQANRSMVKNPYGQSNMCLETSQQMTERQSFVVRGPIYLIPSMDVPQGHPKSV